MDYLNTINNMPEPKLYQRNGKPCYFDEVSKQLRIKTPEETVRQKLIKFLHEHLLIPLEAIEVEVPISYFQKGASGRMDLVVYGASEQTDIPVMVIECKAPSVSLTDDVFAQADHYANIIGVPVVGVTNGTEFILDYWNESEQKYQKIDLLPKYDELCTPQKIKTIDYTPYKYERYDFANLNSDHIYEDAVYQGIISEDAPRKYVPFVLNLHDCLLDDSEECEKISISGYKSIKDMGIRFANFGNAGGGGYRGLYRYFMLEDHMGNAQIASLGIFGLNKTINDKVFGNRSGGIALLVAIDDYDSHHSSLQLRIESNVVLHKNRVDIWHSGRMAVGNIGSAKNSDVVRYVAEQARELVVKDKIFLGSLDNSQPLLINSDSVSDFLSRIIKYAFLRDEYRNILKSTSKK